MYDVSLRGLQYLRSLHFFQLLGLKKKKILIKTMSQTNIQITYHTNTLNSFSSLSPPFSETGSLQPQTWGPLALAAGTIGMSYHSWLYFILCVALTERTQETQQHQYILKGLYLKLHFDFCDEGFTKLSSSWIHRLKSCSGLPSNWNYMCSPL